MRWLGVLMESNGFLTKAEIRTDDQVDLDEYCVRITVILHY